MENLLDFLAGNTCILFFANGLAFFSMCLAVTLETRRVSSFALSNNLLFLAAFGFVASIGNWTQMFYTGLGHVARVAIPPFGQILKLVCFVLAGTFLLEFGVRLTIAHNRRLRWLQTMFWVLLVGYLVTAGILLPNAYRSGTDWVSIGEVWARYLLHAPALALAGFALLAQRRDFLEIKLVTAARDTVGAAIAFGLKLTVSGLVAVPILGLAESTAAEWIVPLQFLRTLTTVAIAVFVVRILRVFELERRRQLDLAVQERFQTQEKALAAQQQACEEIQEWSASMAQTVHSISSAISQPTALDETTRVVLRNTLALAGLQSGAVFLLDEEEQVLHLVAHEGLPPWVTDYLSEVKVGDGLAGWVAQTEELLILDDIAHDPRPFVPRSTDVVKFYVGIPLKAGGKLLGVMNLSSNQAHELAPRHVALLVAAGHQLGVAIEDSRLHSLLRSMAAMEERVRLSRELHDNLAQVLGYLNIKIESIRGLMRGNNVPQILDELQDMEEVAVRAYDDVRDSISALRVRVSPDENLIRTLREYVADFSEHSGIEMTLDTPSSSEPSFAPDTEIQVLRIIQEALTNVRRHAQATRAWVTVSVDGGRAVVVIGDNGKGFDLQSTAPDGHEHLGLLTMRERTESVGGRLQIDSWVGKGTRIELSLPLS
jgi:signal transduction histidine kinase